jgi:hypothetical protein
MLFPHRPRIHEDMVAERLQSPAIRRLAAVELEECVVVLVDTIDGVPIAPPQVVDMVFLLCRASNLQARSEIQSCFFFVNRLTIPALESSPNRELVAAAALRGACVPRCRAREPREGRVLREVSGCLASWQVS